MKVFAMDTLYDFVGSVIFAVGVQVFCVPNNIIFGGVTGIATVFNYLWRLPVGTGSLLINIPLLVLGYFYFGRHMMGKTLRSILMMTVVMDYLFYYVPPYPTDRMIAALFGGICTGLGLALIFTRGSTTGGTDIISRLLRLRYPHMQMGKALLIVDCVILCLSALVFQNIETILYGLIAKFTAAKVIDSVLYGMDMGKLAIIVAHNKAEIAKDVIVQLHRGVTFLKAQGAYANEERDVMLCAVRKQQFHKLKEIVYSHDPSAFVIVTEAGEILGEGFKNPAQSE